jgi:hypothetical protein
MIRIIVLIAASVLASWQDAPNKLDLNLPEVVRERAGEQHFFDRYEISSAINPFYLRGDFDGDRKPDHALVIAEKSTHKRGVAIFLTSHAPIAVLGAGSNFGNGGDDFEWMDVWSVYGRKPVAEGVAEGAPPTLIGEAIWVEKSESSSAIIYWDGKRFRWYQQGD